MTDRELDVLWQLSDSKDLTPMFFGGHDGSYHGATAARLAKRGFVVRTKRHAIYCGGDRRCRCKGSCVYRRTPAGAAAFRAALAAGWKPYGDK